MVIQSEPTPYAKYKLRHYGYNNSDRHGLNKNGSSYDYEDVKVRPSLQTTVTFGEGLRTPSDLFGSLKKAGQRFVGAERLVAGSLTGLQALTQVTSGISRSKCQCRHHQKKLLQNENDENNNNNHKLSAINENDHDGPQEAKGQAVNFMAFISERFTGFQPHFSITVLLTFISPVKIIIVSAGSEGAPEQDSLDGHLVSPAAAASQAKRTQRRSAKDKNKEDGSSSDSEYNAGPEQTKKKSSGASHNLSNHQSKPALKITMDRAHSNFSQKSGVSKTSKVSKAGQSRPSSNSALASKKSGPQRLDLNPFSGVLWDRRESFAQLWVTLSAMYGKILVLLMLAFCLIEVMDNKIRPLYFQNFFMMYLYCGSIIAIMCIYITVLLDNCPSVTNSRENLTHNTAGDPEVGSIGSLGTLRRAHISRNKVSRTSFYLRVGALGEKSYIFFISKYFLFEH